MAILDKQFEIEYEIKLEQKRMKKVKARYTLIDTLVAIWIILASFVYVHMVNVGHEPPALIEKNGIVGFIVDISTNIILVISALFLTITIKRMANKQPNTGLLLWHIFNFLIITATLILAFVFSRIPLIE